MKKLVVIAIPILVFLAGIISLLITGQPYESNPLSVQTVWYGVGVIVILVSLRWRVPFTTPKNKMPASQGYVMAIAIVLTLALGFIAMILTGILSYEENWQTFGLVFGIGAITIILNALVIGFIWQGFVLTRALSVYSVANSILFNAIIAAAWLTLTVHTNEFLYMDSRIPLTILMYFICVLLIMLVANILMYATGKRLPVMLFLIGALAAFHALNSAYIVTVVSGSPILLLATWIGILTLAVVMLWRTVSIRFEINYSLAGTATLTILALVGTIWFYQSPEAIQNRANQFLQENSLFSNNVNWEDLSSDVSMNDILAQLNDPHALYFTPEQAQSISTGGSSRRYGLIVLTPSNQVALVYADSPASEAGILMGDRLLSVNGEPLPTSADYDRVRLSGEEVDMIFERDGEPYSVTLTTSNYSVSDLPITTMMGECIAYIELPATLSAPNEYHTRVTDFLSETDSITCGYIIDLRRNPGGNVYSMMAAIGSIAGHDALALIILPDGETHMYRYVDGQAMINNQTVRGTTTLEVTAHRLQRPVVVLTSSITASSGEITSILFRGRENTLFIGEPTSGVPTATTFVWLANGARLGVTGASIADRTGQIYLSEPIMPDEIIETDWALFAQPDDPIINVAVNWIEEQTD